MRQDDEQAALEPGLSKPLFEVAPDSADQWPTYAFTIVVETRSYSLICGNTSLDLETVTG